ncbi:MAG TPA: hypothetical protein VHJ20_14585 [Polyangia bacterium]|nr:hypothetical protein [Polyangia bacterium]
MKLGMKRDVEASKAFAAGMSKAGVEAVKALGEEMKDIGDGVAENETAFHLLQRAAVGMEKAHAVWTKGAVEAMRGALATRRNPRIPDPVQPARRPSIFLAKDCPTVAISGTVKKKEIEEELDGTGVVPLLFDRGGEKVGVVHMYLNHIRNTPFGDYHEIFLMTSVCPTKDPIVWPWTQLDNPAYVVRPMFARLPNYSLGLHINASDKGRQESIIGFGREILGLRKEALEKPFTVSDTVAAVKAGPIGKWDLKLKEDEVGPFRVELAASMGLVESQLPSPPPDQPFQNTVITHVKKSDPLLTWVWEFTGQKPPKMNEIKRTPDNMGRLLTKLGFEPRVSTWLHIKEGHIDGVDAWVRAPMS